MCSYLHTIITCMHLHIFLHSYYFCLLFPTDQMYFGVSAPSFCRDFLIIISLFVFLSYLLHSTCAKPSCSSARLHRSSPWQEEPPTLTHSPSSQRPLSWRMERMLLSMRWQWRGPCSTLLLVGEGPETRSKSLNFVQLYDSSQIKIWW